MRPDRDAIGALAIAALAVLGIGLVAATLTTTYTVGFEAGTAGSSDGEGIRTGPAAPTTPPDGVENPPGPGPGTGDRPPTLPEVCISILTDPGVILGIVAAFAVILAIAYRGFELLGAAFAIYLIGLPVTIAYALATQCPGSDGGGGRPFGGFRDGPWPAPGPGEPVASIPPALLVGLFGLTAIGAVVLVVTASGDESLAAGEPVAAEEQPDLSQFAAAAGEAADRIEISQATVDNAVYRAWREMTELLEVGEPETTTSGEFAEAAIEVGLARDDVEELTRLFDEVRYGEMDPAPREELALETLRTIEETYRTP